MKILLTAKKYFKLLAEKNKKIRTLYRYINLKVQTKSYAKYADKNEINEKLVVFESFQGRGVGCNPKALFYDMQADEKYKEFQFVWVLNDTNKHLYLKKCRNTIIVKRLSEAYNENMSKAKYIIFNSGIPAFVKLKESQVYIQTWHGTPLKRLGCDISVEGSEAFRLKDIRKTYTRTGNQMNYLLSPSSYTSQMLSTAFGLSEEQKKQVVVELGYPRNQNLFRYTENELIEFKNHLGIPLNKKVILYAPTFRDNQYQFGVGFQYNGDLNFDKIKKKTGDDCIILFRAHCQIADEFDFEKYEGFVLDVSKYDDVNELYAISDLLITDYSSVFFDYANLHRPIIFYMYDLNEYKNTVRDFYLKLEELPGPIVEKEDELVEKIAEQLEDFVYDEKYMKFNQKFNYLDGPEVGKKVLDKVINVSESKRGKQ